MPVNGLGDEVAVHTVHGNLFEIPTRYSAGDPLPGDEQRLSISAKHVKSGGSVALQKYADIFQSLSSSQRTLRELRILRGLSHENIVGVKDVFFSGPSRDFQDVYVACELMEADLATIVKSSQELTDDHCQFFVYQILRGCLYMHSANVIHRDISPRNLLVNGNCDLKISNFGMAHVTFPDSDFRVCSAPDAWYVRWYTAPEVICNNDDCTCTPATDVWSVGCVFAELLSRKPLFPAVGSRHQLNLIVNILGSPSPEDLAQIPDLKCRKFIQSMGAITPPSFEVLFGSATVDALDFLRGLLQFDARWRMSMASAIQHPYLVQFGCPADEPIRTPLNQSDFEFERRRLDVPAFREELYREALQYYPKQLAAYREDPASESYSMIDYPIVAPGEVQYSSYEDEGSW